MEAANFRYDHPRGPIWGFIGEHGLRALWLPRTGVPERPLHFLHSAPNVLLGRTLRLMLDSYFSGAPQDFSIIEVDLSSGTPFQRAVWEFARTIPWGITASYGDIARGIGKPAAARAVGGAMGANPVPIIVPCHRVVGAQGQLTGFAAGLDWKVELLQLEQRR